MNHIRRSIIFVLTLAAAGAALLLPTGTVVPNSAEVCARGNLASANGSAHHKYLSLSFGAFDHGGGNFTGQVTYINDVAKTKVTIDVECISVVGNRAFIGGLVRKSNDPALLAGVSADFLVEDNGEGEGAPADRFSLPAPGGCGKFATQNEILPSDAGGNIQVRFVAPDKDCTKCPAGTHCGGNGECVGGGGGGGGGPISCPVGYKNCCGQCVPDDGSGLCPACPADPKD